MTDVPKIHQTYVFFTLGSCLCYFLYQKEMAAKLIEVEVEGREGLICYLIMAGQNSMKDTALSFIILKKLQDMLLVNENVQIP